MSIFFAKAYDWLAKRVNWRHVLGFIVGVFLIFAYLSYQSLRERNREQSKLIELQTGQIKALEVSLAFQKHVNHIQSLTRVKVDQETDDLQVAHERVRVITETKIREISKQIESTQDEAQRLELVAQLNRAQIDATWQAYCLSAKQSDLCQER